jgi:DNA polymerase III subunit epsilon
MLKKLLLGMFAIVDIETTGGSPAQGGITEVAVVLHDGTRVLDKYETLINPLRPIPGFITGLTGIDQRMVEHAPTFEQIAGELMALLDGKIFVAHNVNFDYSFLKTHFEQAGMRLQLPKLCTVRWARKVMPGFPSYSLGRLCEALEIPVYNRHRAMGDAFATAQLLSMLFEADQVGHWRKMSKQGRAQYLPPALDESAIAALPDATGVYYFRDDKGKVLYVGKAKSIRSRVKSHFSGAQGQEKRSLRERLASVTFTLAGDELVASLMEVAEIKRYFPEFNRAQKYPDPRYGLFDWTDRQGFLRLSMAKVANGQIPIFSSTNRFDLRNMVHRAAFELDLCPRLCGVELEAGMCSPQGNPCPGYCIDTNQLAPHNERMSIFMAAFKEAFADQILWRKGRFAGEKSFVLIENGIYKGYGFVPADAQIRSIQDLIPWLQVQKEDAEARRVLEQYLRKEQKTPLGINISL